MDKKNTNLAKGSLILRIIVSAYLLYTVYGLWGSVATTEGNEKIIIIVAMVVFTLVAVPLGGFSIRALTQGNYMQNEEADETKEIDSTEEEK